MGLKFIDKFSLLHFAVGIVAYFIGIKFWLWILLNIIFEIVENTQVAIKFINDFLAFWPGGKKDPDTIINSIGDIFFGGCGWILGYLVYNKF
jgi:hypothetical protein